MPTAFLLPALLLAATAQPAPEDVATGRWRTETNDGIVEVRRCGASLCGRILASEALRADPDLRDSRNRDTALRERPLRGLPILSGFRFENGRWVDGRVYNPEDGRTYSAQVTTVGADQLRLRGCVVAPLCRTQTWTRIR